MTNHIKTIHDDNESWCGEKLNNEFYFKSVEHAVLNGLHSSTHGACPKCTDVIITCLKHGKEKFIDESVNSRILSRT